MDQTLKPPAKTIESEGRRLSLRQTGTSIDSFNQKIYFSDNDVNQIFDLLSCKGSRLFISFSNNKPVLQKFKRAHLYDNVYMKIGVRKILYDMANQRKIGKNLKGMSKLLLQQIQQKMWEIISLQIKLYHKNEQIKRCSELLNKNPDELFKLYS